MKMVRREAQLACPGDTSMQQRVIDAWDKRLATLDLSVPPPAVARHLNSLVREMTGCGDLYADDKGQANARLLELLPGFRDLVAQAGSGTGAGLALALELAIIGNYIDRGVELDVDWEQELQSVSKSLSESVLDDFASKAVSGTKVLILGDNTGEIVLDMLVVEELLKRQCDVTYAVRSKPVINDATMQDARSVGMTDICEVVESGVDTPGTVIERCSDEFLDRMRNADLILSKGQGNFEALVGSWPDVFFAFKVKCQRVSRDTGLALGTSVFSRHEDLPGSTRTK